LKKANRRVALARLPAAPAGRVWRVRHALFDRRQIVERKRALVGEVVVEAVFDDRPDGHLRRRKEFLDRVGHQVRRRVANHLEPSGSFSVMMPSWASLADQERGIDQTAIDLARQAPRAPAGTDRSAPLRQPSPAARTPSANRQAV
jgi:hypothetical protein